jgi:hypothetical protein
MCVSLLSMASMAGTAGTAGGALQLGGLLQAGSGLLNAVGDYSAGKARSKMNEADAQAEIAAGRARAGRIRDAGERELSTARAQASASGVKLTSGSVLEVEREIVRNVEQDAGSAMLTAERRADALRRSSAYYNEAGRNSAMDSLFGAATKWVSTRRPGQGGGSGWESILTGTRGTGD